MKVTLTVSGEKESLNEVILKLRETFNCVSESPVYKVPRKPNKSVCYVIIESKGADS